ncbi:MAG: transposase, partial [Pseudomonadota bacterium]
VRSCLFIMLYRMGDAGWRQGGGHRPFACLLLCPFRSWALKPVVIMVRQQPGIVLLADLIGQGRSRRPQTILSRTYTMPKSSLPANPLPAVFGLDVSKATVTIHELASRRTYTVANEADALKDALVACPEDGLIVCESTGGYERICLSVALTLGRDIHRADAARVKAFIRSHGEQAKTDNRDAYWIAQYGADR